ncbi:condensin complex subunit 2/barren [Lipomyces arxii]|uniref:condensin complex subunit 2/barren n=1 Tax=Lipomyces arxii TaxID=56418 RepID=UPI0034CEEEA7
MPRQSFQIADGVSNTPRRSKKMLNRQHSMSPSKSSRVSTAASTPMLNDDRSEKMTRITNKRNAVNDINKNLLSAAATTRREPYGDDHSSSTVKVPNLSNFDEWMKLATDNKINATNSWNFALIDYFHDMSLLKEGDGINFQKASCTLDGCVKIYSSRIDSVATETGKLLSGLAENDSKSRRSSTNDDDENADADDDDDDDDDSSKTKKSKRRIRSEATLAKDFSAIQQKKLDLEFLVDPLFKKASADFDEGGAKGLLLNHLAIDNTGRVVFDTSEEAKVNLEESTEIVNEPIKELDLDALRDRHFGDAMNNLDDKFISPSLKNFEFPADPDAVPLNISFLTAYDDDVAELTETAGRSATPERYYDMDAYEPDDDNMSVKEEFGNGGDMWLSNLRAGSEVPEFDDGIVMDNDLDDEDDDMEIGQGQNLRAYMLQFANANAGDEEGEIMSYFNENRNTGNAGLEHWKIQKTKKDTTGSKKTGLAKERKKKEEMIIDFYHEDDEVDEDTLFEQGVPSTMLLPRTQWRSESRNLLEDEVTINSKQFTRQFKQLEQLRFPKPGEAMAIGQSAYESNPLLDTEAFEDDGYIPYDRPLDNDILDKPVPQTYDADFFNDDALNKSTDGEDSFVSANESLEFSTTEIAADGQSNFTAADAAVVGNLTTVIRHEEAQEEFEFGSQLVLDGSRKFKTEYVNYARVAKKVDVKRLKDNLWSSLDYEPTTTPSFEKARSKQLAQDEGEQKCFSDIVNSLKKMYPVKAMADISTSFCFICLLHLANEKGLDIENNLDFTDLSIRKDPTAVIEEY